MVKKFVTMILLLLMVMAGANAYDYVGVIDNTNKVDMIYDFSEGSGQIVHDKTGKNIDMFIRSGVWSTDVPNANFDYSIQNLKGEIGYGSENIRNSDGATISFWYKPTSVSTSTNIYRIIIDSWNGNDYGFLMRQYNNMFQFFTRDVANNVNNVIDVPFTTTYNNQWIYITGVVDTNNNVQKLYFNGVEVGSTTLNSNAEMSGLNVANIGSNYNGQQNNNGYITGFRVMAKSLSQTEVTNLYNQGGVCPSAEIYLDDFDGIFFQTGGVVNFNGRVCKPAQVSYSLDGGAYQSVGSGSIENFNFNLNGISEGDHYITFKSFADGIEKTFTTKFHVKNDYAQQTITTCPGTNVNDFTEYIIDSNMYVNLNPCFNLPNGATNIKINGNDVENLAHAFGNDGHWYWVYLNGQTNGLDIRNFNLQNMRYDQTGDYDRYSTSLILARPSSSNRIVKDIVIENNFINDISIIMNLGQVWSSSNVDGIKGQYIKDVTIRNNAFPYTTYFIYLKQNDINSVSTIHNDNWLIENLDIGNYYTDGKVHAFIFDDYDSDYFTNTIFRNINYWAVSNTLNHDKPIMDTIDFPICSDITWENVYYMSSSEARTGDLDSSGLSDTNIIEQTNEGCIYQNYKVKTINKPYSTKFPNYGSSWFINMYNPTFGDFIAGNTYYPTSYTLDGNNYDKYMLSDKEGVTIDYSLIRNPEMVTQYVTNHDLQVDGALSFEFGDGTFFGSKKALPNDYNDWKIYPTFATRITSTQRSGSNAPIAEFQVQISDVASDLITSTRTNFGLVAIDDNSHVGGISYHHTGNGNHYLIGESTGNVDKAIQDNNLIERNNFYFDNGNEGRGLRLTGSDNIVRYNYFWSRVAGVRYFMDLGNFEIESPGVVSYSGLDNYVFGNSFMWRSGGTMTAPNPSETYVLYGSGDITFVNNKFYDDYQNHIQIFDETTIDDVTDKLLVKLDGDYEYVYNGQIYTFHIGNYWEYYSSTCADANSDLICDIPYTYDGITDNYPIKEFPFDFSANLNLATNVRALAGIDIWTNNPEVGQTYFVNEATPSIPISFAVSGGEGEVNCNIFINGDLVTTLYNVNVSIPNVQTNLNQLGFIPDQSGAHTIQYECYDQYMSATSPIEGFYVEIEGEESPTLLLTRPTDGVVRQVTTADEQINLGFLHNIVDTNVTCDLYVNGVKKIDNIGNSEAGVEWLIPYPYVTPTDNWVDGATYNWEIYCDNFEQAGVTSISASSSFTIDIATEIEPFVDINIPKDGEVYTLATSTDTIPFSADIKLSAKSTCKAIRDDIVVGVQTMSPTGTIVSFNHITGWINKAYTSKITCENDIDGVLSSVVVSYNVVVGDETQPIGVNLIEPAHQSVVQIADASSPLTFRFTQDQADTDVCKVYVDGVAYATFNNPTPDEVIRADILAGWQEEPYLAYVHCYTNDLSKQGYSFYNTFFVQFTSDTGGGNGEITPTTPGEFNYDKNISIIDLDNVDNTNDNTIGFLGDIMQFIINISIPAGILIVVIVLGLAFVRLIF